MKHVIYSLVFFTQISLAQVGINTTSPDNSSVLDIEATDKGLLIPRIALANITTTMLDGVNTAATGLLIYNTNVAVVGGNGVGFYLFNGTAWEKLTTTADAATGDADFFEEGTTAAPDDINDDLYTLGNLAIGKNTADYPLDIIASGARGTSVLMDGTDNNIKVATRNEISNTGTGQHFGMYNLISGSGSGTKKGIENRFLGTVNGNLIGVDNSIILSNGSDSNKTGTRNFISSNGNGDHTATRNSVTSSGTGNQYASDISVSGIGTGDFYGNRITITGEGINKYGSYIDIDETSTGTHYGVYSQTLKLDGYAGYFLGRLSVGTTTSNNYILPSSRGTANQIMQTDGSGNVSWVDASIISGNNWSLTGNAGTNAATNFVGTTDNTALSFRTNNIQRLQIDTNGTLQSPSSNIKWGSDAGINLTSGSDNILLGDGAGRSLTERSNIIAIGTNAFRNLQNNWNSQIAIGTGAAQNTTTGGNNLAIGANALFSNTTGGVNLAIGTASLSDNINGSGNTAIGLGTISENVSGSRNTAVGDQAGFRNTGIGNTLLGYFASIFTTTGNYNTVIGNEAGRNGDMGSNNTLLGAFSGQVIEGTGNLFLGYQSGATLTNVSNTLIVENSNSTSPLIYGEFDNNVLRANGTLQVGNPTGTGYAFPVTDGTANQIMQTDGSGNVNWVDASTVGSEDADFLEVGTGTAPNAITDNMYTQGALAIGDTSNDESRLNITAGASENYNNGLKIDLASGTNSGFLLRGIDVEINSDVSASPTNVSGIEVENNSNAAVKAGIISTVNNVGGGSGKWNLLLNTSNQSTSTGNITGIWNTVSVGGGSGTQFGVRQRLLDTGGNSSGTLYGYNSDVLNGGSGPSIGFYSLIQTNNSSNAIAFDALHTGNSGTGNKYGLRAIIPTTVGGTNQYGVYSEVLRSGSNTFAGYFLGNVSIGTTSSNNYILPASRGTNGQVMQTDGAGNVSWANSSSFWSRTGTVLDVANTGDDITFSSDQSTISFPITSGTPPAMIHMFGGGTSNSDRMVVAHSNTFSNWGLQYRDSNDSFRFLQGGTDRVVINLGGGNPLVVNGTAEATDFQSATTTYPDYVFESYFEGSSNINPNYQFQDLKVVAEFIQKKGHLPGVKSFAEVKQQGMTINLGETSVKNLEKIEELFLYVIELEKENRQLKETLKKQEERLQKIESFIQNQ